MNNSWKNVLLKNINNVSTSNTQALPKKETINNSNLNNNIKLEETEEQTIRYVNKETSQLIVNARCAKKLTRKDLANNLNLKEDVITDIETGKAIYNGAQIAKIKKYLGVK